MTVPSGVTAAVAQRLRNERYWSAGVRHEKQKLAALLESRARPLERPTAVGAPLVREVKRVAPLAPPAGGHE